MAIPANWTVAWARSRGQGWNQRGKVYDMGYHAPAGTTLAVAEAALPYDTLYRGESGDDVFASRLQSVVVDPDRKTKEVVVGYHYEPPTLEDVLIRNTKYVLVEARSVGAAYRPFADLNGDYVWHEERDPSGGPSYKWEPVAGSGVRHDGRTQFRTRFARDYGMGGILSETYQDSVNGAIYQQYWNFPTGRLRFAAWTRARAPTTTKLWIYDCLIESHPKGWNEETEVQKYEYRAFKIPLRDSEGVLLDPEEHRIVSDWFPTGETYFAENYAKKQWPLILGAHDW